VKLKRFYQLCVALPLAVPALTWPLARFIDSDGAVLSRAAELAAILTAAALVGGVPYLLLALPLLWVFRHRPARFYERFLLVAPLVFAGFLFVFGFVAATFLPVDQRLNVGLVAGGYYAIWGLGVGYFYVGVVHLLRFALCRCGLIGAEVSNRGHG
jgi:hypothetical protein